MGQSEALLSTQSPGPFFVTSSCSLKPHSLGQIGDPSSPCDRTSSTGSAGSILERALGPLKADSTIRGQHNDSTRGPHEQTVVGGYQWTSQFSDVTVDEFVRNQGMESQNVEQTPTVVEYDHSSNPIEDHRNQALESDMNTNSQANQFVARGSQDVSQTPWVR